MRPQTNRGAAWLPLLLITLGLAGCPPVDPLTVDEVEPIGALSGSFTCTIDASGEARFDLGPAALDGTLESTEFVAGLRTQGCLARRLAADRGDVVSVVLLQQTRFDRAQALELNFPVDLLEAEDSELLIDDVLAFAGNGGFGSMYVIDPGEEPNPIARTAGGGVLLGARGVDEGDVVSGSFTDLRMGAL